MEPLTLTLHKSKETKNKVVYGTGDGSVIQSVYIDKDALGDVPPGHHTGGHFLPVMGTTPHWWRMASRPDPSGQRSTSFQARTAASETLSPPSRRVSARATSTRARASAVF